MLFLSLNRQSLPPKKQSNVTTFYKKPSLEFGFCSGTDTCSLLIASFRVECIYSFISELLKPSLDEPPITESFSADASMADYTSEAISLISV